MCILWRLFQNSSHCKKKRGGGGLTKQGITMAKLDVERGITLKVSFSKVDTVASCFYTLNKIQRLPLDFRN